MLRLSVLLVTLGVAFAQFNNHEFLRHPGQQFRQDSNGLQFTQQISHANQQQQGQNFGQAPQQQNFQPQPQQSQPSHQQIMSAIQQLSPQQIASFLRQNPAVAQQLAPQSAPQQPRFQQPPPQQQPQFQQQAPQFRQQAPQPQPQFQQQAAQRNQFSAQQSAPQQAVNEPAKVAFSNVGQAPGGEYQFGFHTGAQPGAKDNSFREEVRLPDGTVKGAYGYVDANGRQRVVRYTAGKDGFQVEGDIHPDPAPAEGPAQSAPQRSAPQQQAQPRQSAPAPVFQQPPQQQQQFGNPGSALASFLGNQRNF